MTTIEREIAEALWEGTKMHATSGVHPFVDLDDAAKHIARAQDDATDAVVKYLTNIDPPHHSARKVARAAFVAGLRDDA